MKRLAALFLCIFILIPTAISAQSGYPEREDLYVNDYADLLASEDEDHLRQGLARFQTDNGIEITVLTIESVNDFDRGATIERFATNLFNQWEIGDAEYNDAILLLVASEDHTLRIEFGDGYGRTMDGTAQRIIDRDILPYFRDGDFASGVIAGANALMDEVVPQAVEASPTKRPATTVSASASLRATPVPRSPNNNNDHDLSRKEKFEKFLNTNGTIILSLIAVSLFAIFLCLNWKKRYGNRNCPVCGEPLERLDSIREKQFLESGELVEEEVGSVDYDVWQCHNCDHLATLAYPAWSPSFNECPTCKRKTVSTTTETIESATTSSTGLEKLTSDCQHCDYHDAKTVVTPMIVESDHSSRSSYSSSSSSSSSFGSSSSSSGGSSSGGGASGSW